MGNKLKMLYSRDLDKITKAVSYMQEKYGKDCTNFSIIHDEVSVSFSEERLSKEFISLLG